MSTTRSSRLAPAVAPPPGLPVEGPAEGPAATFRASPELGEQLRRLHAAQVEVDRRKVEELARLRAIQNRD